MLTQEYTVVTSFWYMLSYTRPRDRDNYTWSLALLRVRPARLAARAILETAVGVLGSGPDLKRVQSVGRAVVLCQVLDNFNLEGDLSDDG